MKQYGVYMVITDLCHKKMQKEFKNFFSQKSERFLRIIEPY